MRPHPHESVVLAAIAAGKPALVEKPLAVSPQAGGRIVRACRASGIPVMVAHTLRFDPLIQRLRSEARKLGTIHMVAVTQYFEPHSRGWIDTPGQGGCLLNTGIHGFDLLRFLTAAEPVSVMAESRKMLTTATDDMFSAVVAMEPGKILGSVRNGRTTRGRSGAIEIVGQQGQITGDHIHRSLARIVGRDQIQLGPIESGPTIVATCQAFAEAVQAGHRPDEMPVTALEGLRSLEMVAAADLSSRTGRRVNLQEIRAAAQTVDL